MTKHTPGPWTFSSSDQFGDTRFYVAQADCATYTPNYSDVATLIAETVSSELKAIQEANARLIAAAPELLEALKLMTDRFLDTEGNHGSYEQVAMDAAYAAIAKAEGPVV